MTGTAKPPYELSVTRHINAPPAKVWQIMTERLAEWWCPKPWRTEIEELEWRAGGAWKGMMRGPNPGDESPMDGIVLEFTPGQRFAFTDAVRAGLIPGEPFIIGIFEISPDGIGTRYEASARHWDQASHERHKSMGFADGWGACADQLKALAEES